MNWLLIAPIILGTFIIFFNFYLRFVRYFIHKKIRGLSEDEYRFVSGFPIIGQLLIAIALKAALQLKVLPDNLQYLYWLGFFIILLDPAGLHVALARVMFEYSKRVLNKIRGK